VVRDARRRRAPHHEGLSALILRRRDSAVSTDGHAMIRSKHDLAISQHDSSGPH